MNRTFATAKDRKLVGIKPSEWIAKEDDASLTGAFNNSLNSFAETKKAKLSEHRSAEISLDSWFPLGLRYNFAQSKLAPRKRQARCEDEEARYFPPGTEITVSTENWARSL